MTNTDMHTTQESDDCLFCQEHLEEAAMRTLEPEDQQRMECHLARCPMCRAELAQIEQSLQLLAYSVEQHAPSSSTRQSLMARFEAERDQSRQEKNAPLESPKPKSRQFTRITRQMPWSYGGIFAGLAVALLVIGAWNFLPFNESEGNLPGGQIEVMAMETTCPDCHDETGGQIGADPKEKDGLVMAWNLDPQRKHEVWCVNKNGHHTKVSDLQVADSGSVMQTISFPDAVGGYQQIYVVRDDGAEELTVIPGTGRDGEPGSTTTPPPPAE